MANRDFRKDNMNCLICGSAKIEMIDTIVSDFVMARVNKDFQPGNNYRTKLCFCKDCSFAFYDYRLSQEEEYSLYKDYRGDTYQALREYYECWYTKKINYIINSDDIALNEQRKQITNMLLKNTNQEIKIALDYGGNEGKSFTKEIGTREKYVYDISGIQPVCGVNSISNQEELRKYVFDFIMCNMLFEHLSWPLETLKVISGLGNKNTLFYIEVPSENPFVKGNKFSLVKNLHLVFNRNYSLFRLIKYYFKTSHSCFMPMKEHINFFTMDSLRKMMEVSSLQVLDIEETDRNSSLGTSQVLSVLFKKK